MSVCLVYLSELLRNKIKSHFVWKYMKSMFLYVLLGLKSMKTVVISPNLAFSVAIISFCTTFPPFQQWHSLIDKNWQIHFCHSLFVVVWNLLMAGQPISIFMDYSHFLPQKPFCTSCLLSVHQLQHVLCFYKPLSQIWHNSIFAYCSLNIISSF